MKRLLVCFFIAGMSSGSSCFADDDQLPLKAPEGWKHEKLGGKAFLFGPVYDGFRANINLATEIADVALDKYVDNAMETAKKALPNLKILKKSEFKTTGGLTGIRCDCSNEINTMELRQIFYFFDGGNGKKLVFTGSVKASKGDELTPTFDSIMKSYAP